MLPSTAKTKGLFSGLLRDEGLTSEVVDALVSLTMLRNCGRAAKDSKESMAYLDRWK